jgi:restriction system protein
MIKPEEMLADLLDKAKERQKVLKEDWNRIADYNRFEKADAIAGKIQEIKSLIEQIQKLQSSWAAVMGETHLVAPEPPYKVPQSRSDHPIYDRVVPGVRTPEAEFYLPILKALIDKGGRWNAHYTVDKVGQMMQDKLTEIDYGTLPSGRDTRWRNTAMWARKHMIEEGLLKPNSPKGVWEITDKGRRFYENRSKTDQ